ncbi:DNA pilot protein [Flyfo microvirus Tbat2_156]|nr:DNA pilot protein [Flyfo microvirus Tbat2_156]
MAIPAWAAAAGTAGIGVAGNVITGAMNSKTNHDSRNFAREQGLTEWERNKEAWNMQNQRDDATWNRQNAYNMAMWDKENAYNSPLAQMARFKEAGLNPNLIYGQSNTGGSIATSNPSSNNLSGTRPGNYSAQSPPEFDLLNGIMAAQSMRSQGAQYDNLKAQNQLIQNQAALVDAQRLRTIIGSTNDQEKGRGYVYDNVSKELKAQNDSDYGSMFRKYQVDALASAIRKQNVETDIALNQDERNEASNAQSIRESVQRILKMRTDMSATEKDNVLKDLDATLKKMDIQYKGVGPTFMENMQRQVGGVMQGIKDSSDARAARVRARRAAGLRPLNTSGATRKWKR